MIGEQLTYTLNELAYYASIGICLAVMLAGVICLIVGIKIMLEDDPDTIGQVPFPRRVDNDDEL